MGPVRTRGGTREVVLPRRGGRTKDHPVGESPLLVLPSGVASEASDQGLDHDRDRPALGGRGRWWAAPDTHCEPAGDDRVDPTPAGPTPAMNQLVAVLLVRCPESERRWGTAAARLAVQHLLAMIAAKAFGYSPDLSTPPENLLGPVVWVCQELRKGLEAHR